MSEMLYLFGMLVILAMCVLLYKQILSTGSASVNKCLNLPFIMV
jgi:hypothetical protein